MEKPEKIFSGFLGKLERRKMKIYLIIMLATATPLFLISMVNLGGFLFKNPYLDALRRKIDVTLQGGVVNFLVFRFFFALTIVIPFSYWLLQRKMSMDKGDGGFVHWYGHLNVGVPLTLLLFNLVATFMIYFYRFIVLPFPQGWDTPLYIYHLNILTSGKVNPVSYLIGTDRPLFICFLYIISRLLCLSGESMMIAAPLLLGALYNFSIFLFTWKTFRSKTFSLIASFISSSSILSVWLSYNFSQFMAFSFLLFLMLATFIYCERGLKKFLVVSFLLSVAILFLHPWTYFIGIVITVSYSLFNRERRKTKRAVTTGILELTPLLFSVPFLAERRVFWVLKEVTPLVLLNPWSEALASHELTMIWFLSALGLIILLVKSSKYFFSKLIFAWVLSVSCLIFLKGSEPNFRLLYRLLFLYPLPILSSVPLYEVLSYMYGKKHYSKLIKPVTISLVVLIGLSAFSLALPRSTLFKTIIPFEAVTQLYKIKEKYGFWNESLIVCIEPGKDNRANWAEAAVGPNVYIGKLDSLLKLEISKNKVVVVPSTLYSLSGKELKILKEGSDGIYVYTPRET